MLNWDVIENEVVLKNYLLDISEKDSERNTPQNRHLIKIFHTNDILKECYLEIKDKVGSKKIFGFITRKLNIPKGTLSCWMTGHNPIPIFRAYQLLGIWKDVCEKSDEEFNKKWNEIFHKTVYYTSCSAAKTKLPKELTFDLAYIMGFILADGYVKSDDKLLERNKDLEYSISMYADSKEFLQYLKKLFYNLFEIKCNLYYSKDKKGSWYTLRCTSKPVHRFFCDVLEFKRGSKTGAISTPEIIKKAPTEYQKAFISGFFDGDGGVGITSKNPWLELWQVSINEKPIPILPWIQDKLKSFRINLSISKGSESNSWRLRTGSKKEISKFYNIIGSRHHIKSKIYEQIRGFP